MTDNELIEFIRSLISCTACGWTIGISFGIAILMILSILDIFKVSTK